MGKSKKDLKKNKLEISDFSPFHTKEGKIKKKKSKISGFSPNTRFVKKKKTFLNKDISTIIKEIEDEEKRISKEIEKIRKKENQQKSTINLKNFSFLNQLTNLLSTKKTIQKSNKEIFLKNNSNLEKKALEETSKIPSNQNLEDQKKFNYSISKKNNQTYNNLKKDPIELKNPEELKNTPSNFIKRNQAEFVYSEKISIETHSYATAREMKRIEDLKKENPHKIREIKYMPSERRTH